jgi:hypothetical protein
MLVFHNLTAVQMASIKILSLAIIPKRIKNLLVATSQHCGAVPTEHLGRFKIEAVLYSREIKRLLAYSLH